MSQEEDPELKQTREILQNILPSLDLVESALRFRRIFPEEEESGGNDDNDNDGDDNPPPEEPPVEVPPVEEPPQSGGFH